MILICSDLTDGQPARCHQACRRDIPFNKTRKMDIRDTRDKLRNDYTVRYHISDEAFLIIVYPKAFKILKQV
jgi:hypothetical protein